MKKKPKSWRVLPKAGPGRIVKPVPDSLQVESTRVTPNANLTVDTNANNELWKQTPEGQLAAKRWTPDPASVNTAALLTGTALASHATGVGIIPGEMAGLTAAGMDAYNSYKYAEDAWKNKDLTQAKNAAVSGVYAGLEAVPFLNAIPYVARATNVAKALKVAPEIGESLKMAKGAAKAQKEYSHLSHPFDEHGAEHAATASSYTPEMANFMAQQNNLQKTGLKWAPTNQFGGKILEPKPLLPAKFGDKPSFEEYYKTVPQDKNDTSSYNLRDAYKELPYKDLQEFANSNAHLPDTYKLPNHPTFSTESKYYKPGMYAGYWGRSKEDDYIPLTPENTRMMPGQSFQTKKNGGKVPMAEKGKVVLPQTNNTTSRDSVEHQVDKILKYEVLRGGPGGTPLDGTNNTPDYNDPKYKEMLMERIYPEVNMIMPNSSAMEKGEAMDFIFNSGWDDANSKIKKDPRAFALQEYYRQHDKSKLDASGNWAGRKNPAYSFDDEYNNTIGKLSENERRVLMNKGRDWYYQNINTQAPGVPSPNYKSTWHGRIWNTNDYKEFDPNNPKFTPKKLHGGKIAKNGWKIID